MAFLLYDRTPVAEAEPYGDCANHAMGHYRHWSALASLGETSLRTRGLPTTPAFYEYEEFPRGRVIYRVPEDRYIINADRKLFYRPFIERIITAFDLPADRYEVRPDSHYRSSQPAPALPPQTVTP